MKKYEPILMKDCPGCGYHLEGLPPVHVCPECGRPYDRDTYVLEAATRSTKASAYFNAVYILAMIAWGLSQRSLLLLIPAIGVLPALVIGYHRRLRSRRVFLVTPSELYILRRGVEEHRYSLKKVRDAKYSWVTGRTTVNGSDGFKAFSIPIRHILSARRARQLVAIIKRRVANRSNDSARAAESTDSTIEVNIS